MVMLKYMNGPRKLCLTFQSIKILETVLKKLLGLFNRKKMKVTCSKIYSSV